MTDISETRPHLLFVYGTLKRGNGNNFLLQRHDGVFIAPAVTAERHFLNDGFPYVFPGRPDEALAPYLGQVRGDLYCVDDAGLLACDRLEGHPTGYTRTPIEVTYFVDGPGEIQVMAGIYFMNRFDLDVEDLQRPDEHGFLEWGRAEPKRAQAFQRGNSRRIKY